jgi:hypothetical protein
MTVLALAAQLITITTVHRTQITLANSEVGSGAAEFGDSVAGLG